MNVAIIPARAGSKRIPGKNVRHFRGRPILQWPILAARNSSLFEEIMVSTDDDKIARLAEALGASVPFRRSAEMSNDFATTAAVLSEVLADYESRGRFFARACCLYPTAILATASDLREGYELLADGSFDVVVPVSAFSYPIWRSLKRDEHGRVALNWPENLNARSQDLPPAYHDAGQWYWFDVVAFRQQQTLLGSNTGSILLPPERVQDVDTEEDWAMAELKHERLFGAVSAS